MVARVGSMVLCVPLMTTLFPVVRFFEFASGGGYFPRFRYPAAGCATAVVLRGNDDQLDRVNEYRDRVLAAMLREQAL
jgi:hypothetical protein